MASIAHGAVAPQPTAEAGAVAATAPDFAALLALNILGALPPGTLPGVALPDGGTDMGGELSPDDGAPEGEQPEPLAMALLALNGVVLPMPGLAQMLTPSPSLPVSSHAHEAAGAMTLSATAAPTATAPNVLAASSPDAMVALQLNIDGVALVGNDLSNAPVAIGVSGRSPDLPTAAILASGGQPQGRFTLAEVALPAPVSRAAPDMATLLVAAPVALPIAQAPALVAPRAKMANGPATPDATLSLMAGILAPTPDMSAGKSRLLTPGVQAVAVSTVSELAAPAPGPLMSPLDMTISGLTVARADSAMTSPDLALGEAGAAHMPVERQLDLAKHDRWVNDLARDIAASASSDGKMSFRLDPPQLGRLAVTLQQVEAGLSVRLDAETAEATQIITQAQPRLMEDLRQQGVRVADASVGTQTGQNPHQNQPQHQGQQGQNMAQANSGQQDQSRQQGRTFDLNGDLPVPQAETGKAAPDANAHGRVA